MARERLIQKTADDETGICTFKALKSGATVKEGETEEVNVNDFLPEIRKYLLVHGAVQKIGDNYAGAGGDVDAAWGAMKDMIAQLRNGQWSDRSGAGEGVVRISLLAEAIARIKGVTVDVVKQQLAASQPDNPGENASEDEMKEYTSAKEAFAKKMAELRKHPAVKKMILMIQLEREEAAAATAGAVPELSM